MMVLQTDAKKSPQVCCVSVRVAQDQWAFRYVEALVGEMGDRLATVHDCAGD